jgi:OHCU decarboxylase
MRSDPADYQLVAPGNLASIVSLLAQSPGEWLPIAGGTDLMVLYSAGKLANRKLVSIWNVPELRQIRAAAGELILGAACTYTDIQQHEVVQREFPLLARAASWTGGIANQNRGTLGGNIVNASPAADSLPALLVYDATLVLISARGERRVLYSDFHTGYKQTLLAPDELIRAIHLPRRFAGYVQYSRKVGARNAQAIAKVCVAAMGLIQADAIADIRIAAGSVAPVPMRLRDTEKLTKGKGINPALLKEARQSATREVRPIDDIRSTSAYRSAVLGNLVTEFLEKLVESRNINQALARWNGLSPDDAANEILSCCASRAWALAVSAMRPFENEQSLIEASGKIWKNLEAGDWNEAFSQHPRIGERKALKDVSAQSAAWSNEEQRSAALTNQQVEQSLAQANRDYETRFGRTFIVCATGKSATEILEILRRRLHNDDAAELREAAEEQRKITNIRIRKWLGK